MQEFMRKRTRTIIPPKPIRSCETPRGTAHPTHPMLQLQRMVGNQRVQANLKSGREESATGSSTTEPSYPDPHASQQDQNDEPLAETNPLEGLKRGDGLYWGTWHLRTQVKLLQQKLNEKSLSNLKVDGMFGPKTGNALEMYQISIGNLPQQYVDSDTADTLMESGNDLPICPEYESEETAAFGNQFVSYASDASPDILAIPGLTCQLGKPPGKTNRIEPQNPSKPNDFKRYKCSQEKELRVHIYAHPSDWGVVGTQFNTCVDALKPYNMKINIDRLDEVPDKKYQTLMDFCELVADAFKANPPDKDSLPIFVIELGKQQLGKRNYGRKWSRDECDYLNVTLPSYIEDFVAVGVNTPHDSTMLHEIGHVAIAGTLGNDHASALGDKENVMFSPGDPSVKRRFLWLKQLRRFCNVKF